MKSITDEYLLVYLVMLIDKSTMDMVVIFKNRRYIEGCLNANCSHLSRCCKMGGKDRQCGLSWHVCNIVTLVFIASILYLVEYGSVHSQPESELTSKYVKRGVLRAALPLSLLLLPFLAVVFLQLDLHYPAAS